MTTVAKPPVTEGEKIRMVRGKLDVPSHPVIPFIEGDGTGPDIWRASCRVLDAAVRKAYGNGRSLVWKEVLAGEKAFRLKQTWLPDDTVEAFREYLVGIKGPLTTPVGGGISSLNVALRQLLDLYVCLRPVRYFSGVPSPVKSPQSVNMVIFRENTEDIYAGIEFAPGTPDAAKVLNFLSAEFPEQFRKIRFGKIDAIEEWNRVSGMGQPNGTVQVGIGFKPVSHHGTARLVRAAIRYAIGHKRKSVTIVHKGNIMKFTEGAFRDWAYGIAEKEFGEHVYTWPQWEREKAERGEQAANESMKKAEAAGKIIVKDAIADIILQQVLTRPQEFDVIATLNLNGDYLSDALAAQVGGIGIAPGGTSITSPGTRCSRRRTARPRSTRTWTRSTPGPSS